MNTSFKKSQPHENSFGELAKCSETLPCSVWWPPSKRYHAAIIRDDNHRDFYRGSMQHMNQYQDMQQYFYAITHWSLGKVVVLLKVQSSNTRCEFSTWALLVKVRGSECNRVPVMQIQHWFLWLGAVILPQIFVAIWRHKAIMSNATLWYFHW